MTELLEQAVFKVSGLPAIRQNAMATMILGTCMKQLSQLWATTRDCPYESLCYVGAILYGCPNYFMHIP